MRVFVSVEGPHLLMSSSSLMTECLVTVSLAFELFKRMRSFNGLGYSCANVKRISNVKSFKNLYEIFIASQCMAHSATVLSTLGGVMFHWLFQKMAYTYTYIQIHLICVVKCSLHLHEKFTASECDCSCVHACMDGV